MRGLCKQAGNFLIIKQYISQQRQKESIAAMQDNKRHDPNSQKQTHISNKQSNLNSMPKQITVNYICKNQEYLWRRIKHEFVQSVTTHCNKHQLASRDDIEDFIYKYMKQLICWLQNRDEGKTSKQIVKFKNQIKDLKKIVKQSQQRVRLRQEKKTRSMQQLFVFVYQMLSKQHKQAADLRRGLKDGKKRIEQSQQQQKIMQAKMVGKMLQIVKHKFNQTLLIKTLNTIASELTLSKNRQKNLIKIAIGLLRQQQNKGRVHQQILRRVAIKSKQCSILRDTIADLQERYIKKCQQKCQSCQVKEVTITKFEQQLVTIAKKNHEMSKQITQRQCQQKIVIRMQEEIAIQKQENENLRKQMRDLSYCLYQLTEKFRSRQLQLVQMSKQYEQALEISQSYQIQMVKMQSNLFELQKQAQALHQENTRMKAEIKISQNSLISLINSYSEKGEISEGSIENKILQLKSIINNLNMQISVYKNQIKEIKQREMVSQIQLQHLREKQENNQLSQTKPISCWSQTGSTAKQTGLEDKHVYQVQKFQIEKTLQMKQSQVQTDQIDFFVVDEDQSSSQSEYAEQCDRGTQYETKYSEALCNHNKEVQTNQMKLLEKISQTQEIFVDLQGQNCKQQKYSQKICELQEKVRQMESENMCLKGQNKDLKQLACSSADELNLVKKSEAVIRKMLQTSRIEHAGTKFQLQQLRHHFNSQLMGENSMAETKDKEALKELEMSLSELKEQNEQLKKHNVQLLDTIQYANSLFNSSNNISHNKILASEKQDKKINLIGYCKSETTSSPIFEIETSENSQKSQQQAVLINNSKNNLKCQEPADIQSMDSYGQAISRLLVDFISQESSQQTKLSAFSTLVSLVNPNKDQSDIFEAFLKTKRLRYKSVEKLESKQEVSKCLDQPGIKEKLFKFLTSN